MKPLAAKRLADAGRALRSAHVLLDTGDVEGAINRAYYAVFYAATAALADLEEYPKTHKGVQDRFNLHFVRSGKLDVQWAKTYAYIFNARQKADYDAFTVFDSVACLDLVKDAAGFVQAVNVMLKAT